MFSDSSKNTTNVDHINGLCVLGVGVFCLFVLNRVSVNKRPKVSSILLFGDREEKIQPCLPGELKGESPHRGTVMDEQDFQGPLGFTRERA